MPAPCIVVGSGPAGLMAAEVLATRGHPVIVIERMPSVGRRLLMAGRGGLNITHAEPFESFLGRYGPEAGWLAPHLRAFGPQAVRDWCVGLEQDTFIGSSGRVFPMAMKASPLLRSWVARLEALGVALHVRTEAIGLAEGGLRVSRPVGEAVLPAAAVVLACGGATWPRLGADGGWTGWVGVPVTPLQPANGGFTVAWSAGFVERHAGEPLKGAALAHGGVVSRGEAVVTAAGLEGGGIYALSRVLRGTLARAGRAVLTLDLRPDTPADRLAARLDAGRPGLSLANRLRRAGLPPLTLALLREAGETPREAAALAAVLKALPLTLTGTTGMARAISTAGGVRLDALDDRLMLRARPGVFAAGEMLDWEAPTGGYLLTACLATGRAAGLGAAAWVETGGGGLAPGTEQPL